MPRVIDKEDDVDLSDVDDFMSLTEFERLMIVVEAVENERGLIDMDIMCQAELYSRYWALRRKGKLQAIMHARSRKSEHRLVGSDDSGPATLAKRGLQDVDAFRSWFAECGIPVMEMPG